MANAKKRKAQMLKNGIFLQMEWCSC